MRRRLDHDIMHTVGWLWPVGKYADGRLTISAIDGDRKPVGDDPGLPGLDGGTRRPQQVRGGERLVPGAEWAADRFALQFVGSIGSAGGDNHRPGGEWIVSEVWRVVCCTHGS